MLCGGGTLAALGICSSSTGTRGTPQSPPNAPELERVRHSLLLDLVEVGQQPSLEVAGEDGGCYEVHPAALAGGEEAVPPAGSLLVEQWGVG